MLTDARRFGASMRSSGSLTVPWIPLVDESRGASTTDPIMSEPEKVFVTPPVRAIATMVARYGRSLVTTTSVHTIVGPLLVPDLRPDEFEPLPQRIQDAGLSIPSTLVVIQALTGMAKTRIAEDLLGVTRQAYYDWVNGKAVSIVHEMTIRSTLDVLRRASDHYSSPVRLRAWLTTPVGSRAMIPMQLLRAGQFDEARVLAMSNLPIRTEALPEWLQSGEINAWSVRDLKRRSVVMRESDSIMSESGPSDPDSVVP